MSDAENKPDHPFCKFEVHETEETVGAWITDRDDTERELFFCFHPGETTGKGAYAGMYPEGNRSMPYAITEQGIQLLRRGSKTEAVFITFAQMDDLLDKYEREQEQLPASATLPELEK